MPMLIKTFVLRSEEEGNGHEDQCQQEAFRCGNLLSFEIKSKEKVEREKRDRGHSEHRVEPYRHDPSNDSRCWWSSLSSWSLIKSPSLMDDYCGWTTGWSEMNGATTTAFVLISPG
ncbi:hypothetical protein V6N12_021705 [Hibiscus sabdariffa]|uniref:Uncharacterized protein n=1 Tax=Hibiscus sabdariffa TaxID=183260 RepID=A0ABR2FST2_9ROSI